MGTIVDLVVVRADRRARDNELLARLLEASYAIHERVTSAPCWQRALRRARQRRAVRGLRRAAAQARQEAARARRRALMRAS